MSLTAYTPESYAGDGSTTSFAINFVFWDDTDIKVILTVDSTGAETTWTDGTEYNLTGGSGATGTLTVVTTPTDYTPASGETLTIKSNRANTQPNTFPAGGEFPSSAAEQADDQMTRLIQQNSEALGRAPKFMESSSTSGITVPEPVADKVIGWNAAGDDLSNIDVGDISAFTNVLWSGLASGDMARYNGTNWVNRTAAQTVSDLSVPSLTVANTWTKTQTWTKGADIASAGTVTLGTDGNYFDITGTTTITGFSGVAGTEIRLQFDGILTFTHHATNLIIPGGANITTAAGDSCVIWMLTTSTAKVMSYTKANGKAVVETASSASALHTSLIESGNVTTSSTSFVTSGFAITATLVASKEHLVTFTGTHSMDTEGGETYLDIFDGTNYASSGTATPETNGLIVFGQGGAPDQFNYTVQGRFTGLAAGSTTFTLYWKVGNAGWIGELEAASTGPKIVASIIEMD